MQNVKVKSRRDRRAVSDYLVDFWTNSNLYNLLKCFCTSNRDSSRLKICTRYRFAKSASKVLSSQIPPPHERNRTNLATDKLCQSPGSLQQKHRVFSLVGTGCGHHTVSSEQIRTGHVTVAATRQPASFHGLGRIGRTDGLQTASDRVQLRQPLQIALVQLGRDLVVHVPQVVRRQLENNTFGDGWK